MTSGYSHYIKIIVLLVITTFLAEYARGNLHTFQKKQSLITVSTSTGKKYIKCTSIKGEGIEEHVTFTIDNILDEQPPVKSSDTTSKIHNTVITWPIDLKNCSQLFSDSIMLDTIKSIANRPFQTIQCGTIKALIIDTLSNNIQFSSHYAEYFDLLVIIKGDSAQTASLHTHLRPQQIFYLDTQDTKSPTTNTVNQSLTRFYKNSYGRLTLL